MIGREFRLAGRPVGEPKLDNFDLVTTTVPELRDGQALVRNTWMSVDPYMRGRMDDAPSYIAPFEIGEPLEGSAVGEVIASRSADLPVGATVSHFLGWREYSVVENAEVIDTSQVPAQTYLGPLGTTGLTAYMALTETVELRQDDIVFVSGAAGAVGSVAGQIARILGASRVIGSAGGPTKGEKLVKDFGFDAAIDYKAGPVGEQLHEVAPDGIDLYVDNVGGGHLEAAIDALRTHGRIAMVGSISGYNATEPIPGPTNLYSVVRKRLTVRGVLVTDHLDVFPEYIRKATSWLAEGKLHAEETVVDGFEQAPEALLGVLRGANTGKMLVRMS